MRRRIETDIDDLVVDGEAAFSDPRLDAASQLDRFAVHRRLAHDTLGVQHALVAVPALSIAGQSRRHESNPPVKAVFLRGLDELMELGSVVNAP